jgi:hypothetical protein
VGIGSLPLFLDTPFVAATSPCSKPAPLPSGDGELDPAGPGGGTELTRRVLLLLVPSRPDSSAVEIERERDRVSKKEKGRETEGEKQR